MEGKSEERRRQVDMDKFTVQQLADILIRKNRLSENEAQAFVCAIFDVIKEGLEADRQVKIKGFGTFKIIDVDPRESVNVNTGERVLIGGHQKITFTPDSVMKEMVNRPFSQFETVILNDGVDFSDVEKEAPAPEAENIQKTEKENTMSEKEVEPEPEEETISEPEVIITPEPEESEIPEPEESANPKQVKEATHEPEKEEIDQESEEEATPEPEDELSYEEEPEHHYTAHIIGAIACLILIAAAAYGGYMFGVEEGRHQERLAQIAEQSKYLDKQKEEITAYKAKADTTAVTEKAKKDSTAKKAETVQNTETADFSTYAMRDPRVRTGAYVIVGTDKVVTARKGQTISKIAQTHLGPGMSCYVEVFNEMNGNDPLKEGTKVKIPKLRHKKAKK